MNAIDSGTLDLLWRDEELRESRLREVVMDRLADRPPPRVDDCVVASYFFALRTLTLQKAAKEISYHATSGIKEPPPGSLLEQCTGQAVGMDAFDATGRLGLLHMAYPLKMLRQPDGHLTSVDILHTVAGAIIFDVYENQDACLVGLQIPDDVIATFPGPAYGPQGVRNCSGFGADEPAFGTILKPTAGITPEEVGVLVEQAAHCPLFMFVKEDENLYPHLDYSPVQQRTRQAMAAIERARQQNSGRSLIFAPHITGSPHEILVDCSGRHRSRRNRSDVQREFCRRHGADDPRSDSASRPAPRDLRAQCGDWCESWQYLARDHRSARTLGWH